MLEELILRAMEPEDVDDVIAIIMANDEDDGEYAQESYRENGIDDQFVLTLLGEVIGVTGYRFANGTDSTYWLSWTYLRPEQQGLGYGSKMLSDLLLILRENRARKLYASISDYQDAENRTGYAAAKRVYEKCGFILELQHPDYYAHGESELIFGLALADIQSEREIAEDRSAVFFNGLNEIAETEDIYVVNWEVKKKSLFHQTTQFTKDDLQIGIEQAREWNARSIFISFPSNMKSVLSPLQEAEFFEAGRLKNYYEDGVDEIHFRFNLSASLLQLT